MITADELRIVQQRIHELKAVIRALLDTRELNLDELEPETRATIAAAENVLNRCER